MVRSRWLQVRLIVLIVLAGGGTFALVMLAGGQTGSRPGPTHYELGTRPAAAVDLPRYSYAALDPALIPALEEAQHRPLVRVVTHIPPIGVYMPRSGESQRDLPLPTLTITPSPTSTPTATPTGTPTSTLTPAPTALPSATPTPRPTATATPDNSPPTLTPAVTVQQDGTIISMLPAYTAVNCAPVGWPAAGLLTQYFTRWHEGVDFSMPLNTPLAATHSGEIIFAGWRKDGYGNLIIVQSDTFITYYAHLTSFNVVVGQRVSAGTIIGFSGSTGNSTGPHLHYEIRINDIPVDPLTFEKRGHPTC